MRKIVFRSRQASTAVVERRCVNSAFEALHPNRESVKHGFVRFKSCAGTFRPKLARSTHTVSELGDKEVQQFTRARLVNVETCCVCGSTRRRDPDAVSALVPLCTSGRIRQNSGVCGIWCSVSASVATGTPYSTGEEALSACHMFLGCLYERQTGSDTSWCRQKASHRPVAPDSPHPSKHLSLPNPYQHTAARAFVDPSDLGAQTTATARVSST